MFNLHLKECEYRFNSRGKDIYQILLKIFRDDHLKLSRSLNLLRNKC